MIKIIKKSNKICVYLNNKIFFVQEILVSPNKQVANITYTFFYVLKILSRFGLISPISKKFGYN
jgi:hypothetical protein